MKGIAISVLLCALLVSNLYALALTIDQRVAYQKAIDEVYWKHMVWPDSNPGRKPKLTAIMSQRDIRSKVEDYLKKSYALADYLHQPITAEQMQAEMERIAKETKNPTVLRELFNALGNDPFIIAECLVRPILVDNLSDQIEDFDFSKRETMRVDTPAFNYHLPQIGSISTSALGIAASDSWEKTTTKGAPRASAANGVWTGTEMIVWGRDDKGSTGGRYDPSTNSWTRITTVGAPTARSLHTAIWTGTEMIIWGGANPKKANTWLNTGGRYNPLTDSWSPTTTTAAPEERFRQTAVWTGKEMVIWGGYGRHSSGIEDSFNSGGRYNPSTDSWKPTKMKGAPSARRFHTAVWTGKWMIVWGGKSGPDDFFVNTGSRYNPKKNSWKPISTAGAPFMDLGYTAVWTGTEMIVWGGLLHPPNNGIPPFVDTIGARYNPKKNSWSATSITGVTARRIHSAVWTGQKMIVWGGEISFLPPNLPQVLANTGDVYDPSNDSWSAITTLGAPSKRDLHSAVWTGTQMIIWGGCCNGGRSGGEYTP